MIGSGSLSFEMLRALVERLPVMICPRWVRVQAQPIAVEDLLSYLLEAPICPTVPRRSTRSAGRIRFLTGRSCTNMRGSGASGGG